MIYIQIHNFTNFQGLFIMLKINILLLAVLLLASCGEKADELRNAAEVIRNAPEAMEEMGKSIDESEKRLKERKAKGDTTALHFNELAKFLPESIPGYSGGEPKGQSTNLTGFSMSTVEQEFVSESNQNKLIKIVLMDYNEAYAMYAGVAYWATLGLSSETSDGFQKSFKYKYDNVAAMEEYSKSSKSAKVYFAIGYRFILSLEENDADGTDNLKNIAEKIAIEELSKL